eukprot:107150-Prymnesium_polylepis.1
MSDTVVLWASSCGSAVLIRWARTCVMMYSPFFTCCSDMDAMMASRYSCGATVAHDSHTGIGGTESSDYRCRATAAFHAARADCMLQCTANERADGMRADVHL